ncbi:MAG: hypothetical protein L0H79_14450 [Intrasporangium sp.]|uniref:hypothetical protein n=1 Tax=Intrasporangium sp. TaxID=1925024 RepID=UPI002649AF5E|nr:hypothetical protein [Intrasporangium sp.]MDN5796942.1 hypothetical protein [Intrasporangium sp.]
MAGFDYEFSYTDLQRPYVEACERVAKARARSLSCRWHTSHRTNEPVACYMVDGQTRRLDLLGRVLELDLPLVCQGVDGSLAPARAFALGMGIAELFLVGRDTTRGEGRQMLRPRKETSLYYPVYELAGDGAGMSMLEARLRISENVLADYALGRVDDSVALEELHTAIEKVMRALVPKSERFGWPELREQCHSLGLLPEPKMYALLTPDWGLSDVHAHAPDEVLATLARHRNRAKHEPQSAADGWLRTHWECVASIIETLAGRLGSAHDVQPISHDAHHGAD